MHSSPCRAARCGIPPCTACCWPNDQAGHFQTVHVAWLRFSLLRPWTSRLDAGLPNDFVAGSYVHTSLGGVQKRTPAAPAGMRHRLNNLSSDGDIRKRGWACPLDAPVHLGSALDAVLTPRRLAGLRASSQPGLLAGSAVHSYARAGQRLHPQRQC